MRLRLATLDDLQFLRCLQHGLWGTGQPRGIKNWLEGDMLALIVKKRITGLAQVTGKPFFSEKEVWDNGLFPNRIRIKFLHVMEVSHRLPIEGPVRDALTASWGRYYGWGILNKQLLSEKAAGEIVKQIVAEPNDLELFQRELRQRIKKAKLEWKDPLDIGNP